MEWKKVIAQPKILLLLGAAGVLLLVGNWAQKPNPVTTESQSSQAVTVNKNSVTTSIDQLEQAYETRMSSMLNDMLGVKDVKVLVNIDSSEVVTYYEAGNVNQSSTSVTDGKGGSQTSAQKTDNETVVMKKGTNQQDVPLVVKTTKPPISGVWIEARGVNDPAVREEIITAIVKVFDIPAHRISITEAQS